MTENQEPQEASWIDEIAEGHRACPVCGDRMHIERKKNVSIDVCPEHGIWLDKGELESIISAINSRARRGRRDAVRRAKRDGKVQGAFWGWWSLLGD
jgi:Zn-finger nucleic acid-binding protein